MRAADRMGLEHEELAGSIIGAAIEVHKALGPGFLESVCENALALELETRGLPFERQLAVPILCRGAGVGWHPLDLLVAGLLVVELEAVKTLPTASPILLGFQGSLEALPFSVGPQAPSDSFPTHTTGC